MNIFLAEFLKISLILCPALPQYGNIFWFATIWCHRVLWISPQTSLLTLHCNWGCWGCRWISISFFVKFLLTTPAFLYSHLISLLFFSLITVNWFNMKDCNHHCNVWGPAQRVTSLWHTVSQKYGCFELFFSSFYITHLNMSAFVLAGDCFVSNPLRRVHHPIAISDFHSIMAPRPTLLLILKAPADILTSFMFILLVTVTALMWSRCY